MHRTSVIVHKGKPIVLIDLAGETDVKVSMASFDRAQELLSKYAPKTGRLLTNVTNARYSLEGTQHMKAFSAAVTPYVKASAAVGLDGLKLIILRSMMAMTGRSIEIFDDLEKAKDWLAEQ